MDRTEGAGDEWWVYYFLLRTFFGACKAHNTLNNHQNQYCITCEMAACQHCLAEGTHLDHKVIKIYRLVYNDVVSLIEMNQYLNCSRIQPYTSNGRLVLALSPLPHYGSGRLKRHRACHHCARRLMDPDRYRFCSIACKFRITTGKSITKPKPRQPPPDNGPDRDDNGDAGADTDTDTNTNTRASVFRRKSLTGTGRRKGIPVRAPVK